MTADGEGVVSHAGAELRELAGFTGLIDAWGAALIGTYKARSISESPLTDNCGRRRSRVRDT